MKFAEVHINNHTLETRHRFVEYVGNPPTCPQADEGWETVSTFMADRHPALEDAIEQAKSNAVKILQDYWNSLAQDPARKVIFDGYVYLVFDPLTMVHLGSADHRVKWTDSSKQEEVCSLISQGKVPNWIRHSFQENAVSLEYVE